MNSHQVATPEMSLEDARSYVLFLRESGGKLFAYVGLYFPRTDRKLYYTCSSNPFSENEMPEVENDARAFAETLGAMLDEMDFSKMTAAEKDRWIDGQDIFLTKKKAESAKHPESDRQLSVLAQPSVEPPAAIEPQQIPLPPQTPGPEATPSVAQSVPAEKIEVRPVAEVRQVQLDLEHQAATTVQAPSAQPPQPVASPKQRTTPAKAPVKAPKAQPRPETSSPAGVSSREKEALARLLASF